jgi:hypothetical protein
MTGLVALDVVIGLVFIYSLYSLLATLIEEIIATNFSFRAKILEKAIMRMLVDEDKASKQWSVTNRLQGLAQLIFPIAINQTGSFAEKFYNHPLIKYLGEDKWHRRPSYLTSNNFSKVIIDLLAGTNRTVGDDPKAAIDASLNANAMNLGTDTENFIKSLWMDAQGDVERFRELLENWFDDTMERATEWYKRYSQVFLLVIGLAIAIVFNVDTIQIVNKLSHDPKLRDQIVQQADAYLKNHPTVLADLELQRSRIDKLLSQHRDTAKANQSKEQLDAVYEAYVAQSKKLQQKADDLINGDLKNAGDALALGWLEECDKGCRECQWVPNGYSNTTIFGWLLTALALSLGAPFWFDLLNKLMKLRGSVQAATASGHKDSNPSTALAGNEMPRNKRVG